ncbi:MAG: toll/interleukin-1 receptor domain-containing protein [Chloroflexota bacterium]
MVLDEKPTSNVHGKAEQPTIFVSHAVADRKLAAALGVLIEEAFSAVLGYFASSDPSPSGGLQPGDEWYARIHSQLSRADAVWVLVTPESVHRPWLYWEAGIGRAICPHGVVVLRVGVPTDQIPSPLSAYQSYDALTNDDDGIGSVLGKVANQMSMKLAPALVADCTDRWSAAAINHKPELGTGSQSVSPEQVDRFEGLIGRLEGLVQTQGSRTAQSTSMFSSVSALGAPAPAPRPGRVERRARRDAEDAEREARAARADAMFSSGTGPGFVESQAEFVDLLEHNPTLAYRVRPVDGDGDLPVEVTDGTTSTRFWLTGDWVESISTTGNDSVDKVVSQIRARLAEDDAATGSVSTSS